MAQRKETPTPPPPEPLPSGAYWALASRNLQRSPANAFRNTASCVALRTATAQGPLQRKWVIFYIRVTCRGGARLMSAQLFCERRRYEVQRPPKNRLNDLNMRPGKVSAF